jgi:hypothetical protein
MWFLVVQRGPPVLLFASDSSEPIRWIARVMGYVDAFRMALWSKTGYAGLAGSEAWEPQCFLLRLRRQLRRLAMLRVCAEVERPFPRMEWLPVTACKLGVELVPPPILTCVREPLVTWME